jgi:hypothetical protein
VDAIAILRRREYIAATSRLFGNPLTIMDPISIATVSLTLVKLCANIHTLISKVKKADMTIRILAGK